MKYIMFYCNQLSLETLKEHTRFNVLCVCEGIIKNNDGSCFIGVREGPPLVP